MKTKKIYNIETVSLFLYNIRESETNEKVGQTNFKKEAERTVVEKLNGEVKPENIEE